MLRPLISYIIATYNHESYVREAIENAFAQTYSPLEIILSDDCSSDNTFEIAQKSFSNYRGPHSLRLNRNDRNLGIAGNINRLVEMSRGELIVVAAGDDVSLPRRTEVTFRAWDQSGRRATSIFSSYTIISKEGVVEGFGGLRGQSSGPQSFQQLGGSLSGFLSTKTPAVNGCTHAWSPRLFSFFGPLTADLEDLVLSFRSLAIGQLLYVPEPLVQYRRHGHNVSFLAERDDTGTFERRERRLLWVDEKSAAAYANMLNDIQTLFLRGFISAIERHQLAAIGDAIRKRYLLEKNLMETPVSRRIPVLARFALRENPWTAIRFFPRLFPLTMYRGLYLSRQKWRSMVRGRQSCLSTAPIVH